MMPNCPKCTTYDVVADFDGPLIRTLSCNRCGWFTERIRMSPNTKKFKVGDQVKCIARSKIVDHQTSKTQNSVHNIGDVVTIRAGTLSYYVNNQECYEKVNTDNPQPVE